MSSREAKDNSFLEELTGNFRWSSQFADPERIDELKNALFDDLKKVPVVNDAGAATNVFEKIESDNHMSRSDKDLFWSCLAMVREMFWSLKGDTGYQWEMNWMHTRAEVDQVFEASKLLNLSGRETRDALIASIFSDSVKSRGNFIVHNVHGAQAAALVLSYFLDIEKPMAKKSIVRICQATKEHQIAPPEFMATIIALMLFKKFKLGIFDPRKAVSGSKTGKKAIVYSIFNKIKDPFNEEHLNEDKSLISFTDNERELLSSIEVYDWYVPHPDNKSSMIAHAVIAGDHSINYNNPEGFAKIALLRGPDTESFFEDETIHHSLESAVHSFSDSFKVIRPEVRRFALSGLRRTKLAVERVSGGYDRVI